VAAVYQHRQKWKYWFHSLPLPTMTVIPQQTSWQETARQVQAVRDRSIEAVDPYVAAFPEKPKGRVIDTPRKYLTSTEQAITESPAETLVASLAAGKLTAVAVTNAFLRRAAIAQKLVSSTPPAILLPVA
jgi:hypothetical protein